VLAEPLDFGILLGTAVNGVEVGFLAAADQFLELLRVGRCLALVAVPDPAVLVVEPMDGGVDDPLDDVVGALRDVEAANRLKEGPEDVLPALVFVGVPAFLAVEDGVEAGPEDGEEGLRASAGLCPPRGLGGWRGGRTP